MSYPFEAGQRYARKQVFEVIGLQDPMGGNWYTGYASHGEDFFIFCNVGTAGRTGHDYKNEWQGSDLVWYAKTGTHVRQETMQRMLDGKRDVYVFWRTDNNAPFTFAGLSHPARVTTTTPVKVLWRFRSS
jgi:5-methylcytosine-specific restriction protein A